MHKHQDNHTRSCDAVISSIKEWLKVYRATKGAIPDLARESMGAAWLNVDEAILKMRGTPDNTNNHGADPKTISGWT